MKSCRHSGRKAIAVLVADANQMACRLLSSVLSRHVEFQVVGCVVDKPSLLRSVGRMKSGVALISSELHDGSPITAVLREIRTVNPALRIILLLDHADPQLIVESLRAGVRGIFSRSDFEFVTLAKCVRRVSEGELWISSKQVKYIVEALADAPHVRAVNSKGVSLLSRREEDVMHLVAEGLGNREIAQQLNLSEHTIKNYLFHIFDKLGISNRVELVLYAITSSQRTARMAEREEPPSASKAQSA